MSNLLLICLLYFVPAALMLTLVTVGYRTGNITKRNLELAVSIAIAPFFNIMAVAWCLLTLLIKGITHAITIGERR